MKVTPKTDAELLPKLLPEGEYEAFVREAKDKVSKSGNDMIEIMLCIHDEDGTPTFVFDYLLDEMPTKLKHFVASTELLDAYNAEELTAEVCKQHNVRVKLRIEEAKNGWRASNKVADYMPSTVVPQPEQNDIQAEVVTQPAANEGVSETVPPQELPSDGVPF